MKTTTIGKAARRAGVGVETVRFYEREGLLDRPARQGSGYRQYGAEIVARLRFIRRAKGLGFTLKEVEESIAPGHDPEATRADPRARALAKVADIEGRVRDLLRIEDALEVLPASCDGHDGRDGCPILHALAGATGVAVER